MPREANGKVTDLSAQAEAWQRPAPLDGQFGPGRPVLPANPEETPRVFEYRPGVNLVTIPRAGFGLASFTALRNLAASCKEIRLNIELIKREIRALEWTVQPVEEDASASIDAAPIIDLLQTPDGLHDFDGWLNMFLEEMLVTDALTIWPAGQMAGRVEALELIDGTTIRPLLDFRGRVSPPPEPAYLQILHGVPTSFWARDKLIYRPFNTSVYSPYGASPIEFVMLAVNLAMRRDVYHVSAFTQGNVPEALVGAPSTWTQVQVETWQRYWDAMVQGNIAEQRKMHFVPLDGGSNVPVYEFKKDDINQTAQDEWLMKVACWAFGNSPAEFGLTSGAGLGGAGYAQGQENIQYRSMLLPVTQFVAQLLTRVIQQWLGQPGLEFAWIGLEPQEDKLQQAQVDQVYISAGVYGPGYVRKQLGIEEEEAQVEERETPPALLPFTGETGDKPEAEPEDNDDDDAGPEEEPAEKFFRSYP